MNGESTTNRASTAQRIARELNRVVQKSRRPLVRLIEHFAYHERRFRHRVSHANSKRTSQKSGNFVLYRILGNDLVPRHEHRQTIRNVEFILANEKPLERCEKRWVLNRIYDPLTEDALLRLLESAGHKYIHIPFDLQAYQSIGLDLNRFASGFFDSHEFRGLDEAVQARARASSLRLKNLYVMNNNGARNIALEQGRELADWVLPWDGNCFLTREQWSKILASIDANGYFDYHVVPMARMLDNTELLKDGIDVQALDEPQVIFHRTAREMFHPDIPYGRRPKIELLSRLGVKGPWDTWRADPWDLKLFSMSPDKFLFDRSSGWVARLASGQPELERGRSAYADRAHARNVAIIRTLAMLDEKPVQAQGAAMSPSGSAMR